MTSTAELHKRRYNLIVDAAIAWANMINEPVFTSLYVKHRNEMAEAEKELAEIDKILKLEVKK